jgi:predicted ATPase
VLAATSRDSERIFAAPGLDSRSIRRHDGEGDASRRLARHDLRRGSFGDVARLVEARIRGLRTLADVTLQLGGLTVLIGDNGAGKSSILEALRLAGLVVRPNFVATLSREHMLVSAIRKDSDGLKLDLRVESEAQNLVYSLDVDAKARRITRESICELPLGLDLRAGAAGIQPMVLRTPDNKLQGGGAVDQHVDDDLSMFEYFGRAPLVDAITTIRQACEGIDVHVPFAVSAGWTKRSTGDDAAVREPRVIEPSRRLELFGANLATVYHALKNSGVERWRETMDLLRLGIGAELEDVSLSTPGSGHVELSLELRDVGHVPAFHLADGHLAYLAFVALVQLDEGRSMLAFDEPEQHLHPGLLTRVVQLLDRASTKYPVVIATHSDRLLDCLPDPAAAVRVCELDRHHQTQLLELDSEQLAKWADLYSGLGQLRAEGQLRSVIAREQESAA